jgi:hypothetical protein
MSFNDKWNKNDAHLYNTIDNFSKGIVSEPINDELDWEVDFLNIVTARVQETIEQIATENYIDLAYYKFKLIVDIMANDFYTKLDEKVLINPNKTFCSFCGKPTNLYFEKNDLFVCSNCFKGVI